MNRNDWNRELANGAEAEAAETRPTTNAHTCPACGGEGAVEGPHAAEFTDPCEACEGTGKVEPARFDESSHYRAEG